MLKMIARMGLILLAAGLVCAGFYLVVNASAAEITPGEMGEHPAMQAGTRPYDGERPARPEGGRGGHGQEGGTWMGAGGIAINLGKVALITLSVTLAQWLVTKRPRRVQTA